MAVETKKPTCTGCFFEGKILETLRCASCERSDHKNVIFKKIEGVETANSKSFFL